jgi:hypothetical protein
MRALFPAWRRPTGLVLLGVVLGALVAGPAHAASPAAAGEAAPNAVPESLVVLDVEGQPRGFPAWAGPALVEGVVGAISLWDRIRPMSVTELKAALRLEVDRQNLGCAPSSCMAVLADAYGARWVVLSRFTRASSVWTLSLSLFDSQKAAVVGRGFARAPTIPGLQEALDAAVVEMMAPLGRIGRTGALSHFRCRTCTSMCSCALFPSGQETLTPGNPWRAHDDWRAASLTRWVCWSQRRPGAPSQQRGAVVDASQRGDVLVVVNGPRLRRRWRAIDDACARRRAGVVDGRRALRGVSGRRRRQ